MTKKAVLAGGHWQKTDPGPHLLPPGLWGLSLPWGLRVPLLLSHMAADRAGTAETIHIPLSLLMHLMLHTFSFLPHILIRKHFHSLIRSFSMNHCYPFVNTPLPYDYDALEPWIDRETMFLHHARHLQTYIDNLNTLLEQNPCLQNWSLEMLLCRSCQIPCTVRTAICRNAGGVYNHRFFFDGLRPPARSDTSSALLGMIRHQFGGFEAFQDQFLEAALSVFGSGYAWLMLDQNCLRILTSANQDTPLMRGGYPLLTLDVWEHAYYLKHHNLRADYIADWFHVIDWEAADLRLQAAEGTYPPFSHRME